MEIFNQKNLGNLKKINDAVKKYNRFKAIYSKAIYYISKLPYGHIDNIDSLYSQIKNNLDRIYNENIISALKSNTENQSLTELENVITDLNSAYGYGFDNYISQYHQSLYEIINKHRIIYKNYKMKLKEDITINIDYSKDPIYKEIVNFVTQTGKASASLLQRRFRLGYNRAAQLLEQLEDDGLIGPQNGSKPRAVLADYNSNYIPKGLIDFVELYGTDYEAVENEKKEKAKKEKEEHRNFINTYVDMAQSYFDEKGLKIKFNKSRRINKNKLNNSLFTNTTSEDVEKLVKNILSMSVPNELKLLLIDYSQINLFEYNGLANLYAPVISDYRKAKTSLDCLGTEMNRRYELFLEKRVKNIDSYNNVDTDFKLPYIVVVINEIFEMLKFENTREIFTKLLLNCRQAGIVIMCFSKFNKKTFN